MQAALGVYEKRKIAGSPEKDVVNALGFTALIHQAVPSAQG